MLALRSRPIRCDHFSRPTIPWAHLAALASIFLLLATHNGY